MVCRDAVRGKLNVLGPPGTHCRTRGEQPSADGLRRALLRPARLSHVLLPELPGSVPPGRVLRGQDPQGCRRPRPGRWGRITYKVRFAQTWTTNASPPWLSSPCNRKSTSLSQSGRRRPKRRGEPRQPFRGDVRGPGMRSPLDLSLQLSDPTPNLGVIGALHRDGRRTSSWPRVASRLVPVNLGTDRRLARPHPGLRALRRQPSTTSGSLWPLDRALGRR